MHEERFNPPTRSMLMQRGGARASSTEQMNKMLRRRAECAAWSAQARRTGRSLGGKRDSPRHGLQTKPGEGAHGRGEAAAGVCEEESSNRELRAKSSGVLRRRKLFVGLPPVMGQASTSMYETQTPVVTL
jgi:hypothetical protein